MSCPCSNLFYVCLSWDPPQWAGMLYYQKWQNSLWRIYWKHINITKKTPKFHDDISKNKKVINQQSFLHDLAVNMMILLNSKIHLTLLSFFCRSPGWWPIPCGSQRHQLTSCNIAMRKSRLSCEVMLDMYIPRILKNERVEREYDSCAGHGWKVRDFAMHSAVVTFWGGER